MPPPRSIVLGLVAAAAVASGCSAEDVPRETSSSSSSSSSSGYVSRAAIPSEESLDRALHRYAPAFKHGVFERPYAAVNHLHDADPVLAQRIVAAARLDLVKRQAGSNSTTTATTTTTTATTDSSSTTSSSFITTSSSTTFSDTTTSTDFLDPGLISSTTTSSSSFSFTIPSFTPSFTTPSFTPSFTPSTSTNDPFTDTSSFTTPTSATSSSSVSSTDLSSLPPVSFPVPTTTSAQSSSSSSSTSVSGSSSSVPPVTSSFTSSTVQGTGSTASPGVSSSSSTAASLSSQTTQGGVTSSDPSSPADSAIPTPTTSSAFIPSFTPSTTPTAVYIPVPYTSVDNGATFVSTGLSERPVTNFITVPITSTNCQGAVVTSDFVLPALVYPTVDANGNSITATDILPGSEPTPTEVCGPTLLTAPTAVVTRTLPPIASGAIQSVIVQTTEIAGTPAVITRTIVVLPSNVPEPQLQPADNTQGGDGPQPSLQSGTTALTSFGRETLFFLAAALATALVV